MPTRYVLRGTAISDKRKCAVPFGLVFRVVLAAFSRRVLGYGEAKSSRICLCQAHVMAPEGNLGS